MHRRVREVRDIAAIIVLAAVLLRALLPAGWMPGPATEGSDPFLVICHGFGKADPAPTSPSNDPEAPSGPCIFASGPAAPAAAGPMAPAPALRLLVPTPAALPADAPASTLRLAGGLGARAPPFPAA